MKINNISYTPVSNFLIQEKVDELIRYLHLSAEYGCGTEGKKLFDEFQAYLDGLADRYQALVLNQNDPDEPDDLETIRTLRPAGARKLTDHLPKDYRKRLEGALYGRMAGCTLGAALEFEPVEKAKAWALHFGDQFPPADYWSHVKDPMSSHYITGKNIDLTKGHMNAVPPDDDTVYTLLGLLLMEQYGFDFTGENLAEIWKRYLPLGPKEDDPGQRGCWWGERQMLKCLLNGMTLPEAGLFRNPILQNIAAWTRADSYGYVCAGCPEKAAELAYRDAFTNHRRNGVYGSMFMAAVIAAAFVVDDPMEAVQIGLSEIPENCLFAEGVRWALEQNPSDYKQAYDLVWERYAGMFNGSALSNALHVIMGLSIGKKDFTKTIGETVAMSGDNDCTGATAGSILGAVIGIDSIPSHWTAPFQGRMHIYLNEQPEYLPLQSVCDRFERLAEKLHHNG